MSRRGDKNKKPAGIGLRILSFIPAFNWLALIVLGSRTSRPVNSVLGVLYGVVTFVWPQQVAFFTWIVVIVHFSIAAHLAKRSFGADSRAPVQAHESQTPSYYSARPDIRYTSNSAPDHSPEVASQSSAQTTGTSHTQSSYVDVSIPGSLEKRESIPVKSTPVQDTYPSTDAGFHITLDIAKPYSEYPSRDKFIRDMKRFANVRGKPAAFVPFQQYWPMYDNMSRQQQAWYFYWRSEVRNKTFLDTDLSYIYVHVYELLNGVGWDDPKDGYQQLMALWISYRERFPVLDYHLFYWIFDFAVIHNLPPTFPCIPESLLSYHPEINDYLIESHSTDTPLKLPFPLIQGLCDYRMSSNKFYRDGHQDLMMESIPRVVALADAASRKKNGRGILAVYGPNRPRKQAHDIYQSALHPEANKRIYISVKAYTTSQPLRTYMNELVRYAENSLRELYDARGRLRDVSMDAETASLIDAFLKKEYSPTSGTQAPAARPVELNLDFGSIEELRVQSDAVREALAVEEECSDVEVPPTDNSENTLTENTVTVETRPDNNGCDYFNANDLPAELRSLIEAMTPVQQQTLFIVLTGEDIRSTLTKLAEENLTLPEMLIDEINDTASQYLDDVLIDALGDEPRILEQYESALKAALK